MLGGYLAGGSVVYGATAMATGPLARGADASQEVSHPAQKSPPSKGLMQPTLRMTCAGLSCGRPQPPQEAFMPGPRIAFIGAGSTVFMKNIVSDICFAPRSARRRSR